MRNTLQEASPDAIRKRGRKGKFKAIEGSFFREALEDSPQEAPQRRGSQGGEFKEIGEEDRKGFTATSHKISIGAKVTTAADDAI
ncbi:MAG: hypothetical protein HYZ66_09105 [Chlamydiae bacterium]|nr:hypothetical protein [Chlamydiota bacterium]